MMKSAVAVNAHGKIVKVFSWASEELIAANTTISDIILDTDPPQNRSSYWDFDSEHWREINNAPTSHHIFNYESKQWQDCWTYDDYLAQALRKARNDEILASAGGFYFNDKLIQSDSRSQMIISNIVIADTIDWITADNSQITLDAENFNAMKLALSTHLQTTRATYNELKNTLPTYSLIQLKAFIADAIV